MPQRRRAGSHRKPHLGVHLVHHCRQARKSWLKGHDAPERDAANMTPMVLVPQNSNKILGPTPVKGGVKEYA